MGRAISQGLLKWEAGMRDGPGVSMWCRGEGGSWIEHQNKHECSARSEGERWGRPRIWYLTVPLSISPSISSLNSFLNEHLLHARDCVRCLLVCKICVSQRSYTFTTCSRSSQGCPRGATSDLGREYAEHKSNLLISGNMEWITCACVHKSPTFAHTCLFSWNSVFSTNNCFFP